MQSEEGKKRKPKRIEFRATIEYVPYPSEEARDEAYRSFVRASLRAFRNKIKQERKD